MKELIIEVCKYERLTNCIHEADTLTGQKERAEATNRIVYYFGSICIMKAFDIDRYEARNYINNLLTY